MRSISGHSVARFLNVCFLLIGFFPFANYQLTHLSELPLIIALCMQSPCKCLFFLTTIYFWNLNNIYHVTERESTELLSNYWQIRQHQEPCLTTRKRDPVKSIFNDYTLEGLNFILSWISVGFIQRVLETGENIFSLFAKCVFCALTTTNIWKSLWVVKNAELYAF